ncbi:AbrB/MazE/SpoVT family DNA-binding domain-containing protein [Pyrobaculum sp. 3827-6]|uniref:AbrB/MazE/SpoVT family DNA-binding domain-containing protein n=1 Tax=Pyrobaculum sp. 3827-6 TaxID=2983604 RepID=UPI0021DB2A1D|nr:AbrB/MazE/SpoVT family DNA-binding domain-containing protein [Pyrobaculum sp. 3827-6]MCU7787600.1 AbrB/MazE/SpoVT family DNA-binding domain-containing protein [Pyrobaculum sp. 3827-6]
MATVKVTRNYQITIPAGYRKKLGIKIGDVVTIYMEGDRLVLVPAKRRRITFKAGRTVNVEELERAVEKALDEAVS